METNQSTVLFFGSNLGLRVRARRGAVRIAVLGVAIVAAISAFGGRDFVAESPLSWVVLTLFARITGVG